jgi:hypothetical protein
MVVGLDDDERRTETLGCDQRLCRVDAIAARLVTSRRHDRPRPIVGHGHGQSLQGRIVTLLDGSKKLVHVNMYDTSRLHML